MGVYMSTEKDDACPHCGPGFPGLLFFILTVEGSNKLSLMWKFSNSRTMSVASLTCGHWRKVTDMGRGFAGYEGRLGRA